MQIYANFIHLVDKLKILVVVKITGNVKRKPIQEKVIETQICKYTNPFSKTTAIMCLGTTLYFINCIDYIC